MTALALVIVLWVAVLVPPAVKRHNERRQEFLDSFQKGLGALGATAPSAMVFDLERSPAAPVTEPRPASASASRPSAAQRRRTILALLLASMAISAVPAVVLGGKTTLAVFLAVSDCFLAYMGLIVRWRDARTAALRPAARTAAHGLEPRWEDDDEPLIVAPRVRAAM